MGLNLSGLWGPEESIQKCSRTRLEWRTREGDSPVRETRVEESQGTRVGRGTRNPD